MDNNAVWIVLGATESGDEVGPYVWDYEPSDLEINLLLAREWSNDYESGTVNRNYVTLYKNVEVWS